MLHIWDIYKSTYYYNSNNYNNCNTTYDHWDSTCDDYYNIQDNYNTYGGYCVSKTFTTAHTTTIATHMTTTALLTTITTVRVTIAVIPRTITIVRNTAYLEHLQQHERLQKRNLLVTGHKVADLSWQNIVKKCLI